MIRPTHAYIGRCRSCNAGLSSVYDMADDRKFTASSVAKMIASGLDVERVPLGSVEIAIDGCACRRDPTMALPLFAQGEV